jgi:hypothetical protein
MLVGCEVILILAMSAYKLQAFDNQGVPLASTTGETEAIRANDFLESLGAVTHIIQGIDSVDNVKAGIRYLGIRNIRDDGTTNRRLVRSLCSIHAATGAMVDELAIGGDLRDTQAQWDQLAACGALVAAEGPNEPNNFSFSYKGGQCAYNNGNGTFLPCAQFQSALYRMVHSDPQLAGIQVWGISDVGAEPDNVGLQWLKIPSHANALLPDGTTFADVANTHNYVQGRGSAGHTLEDNQAFWAESVQRGGGCPGCFDVYGEYWAGAGGSTGQGTWGKGYPTNVLGQNQIPKVTTETGWNIRNTPSVSAELQGRLLTDVYLQAYRQGWDKTFIYLMFNNSTGDDGFGMLNPPARPTLLGRYIHNLTSILADNTSAFTPGRVNYSISGMPPTGYSLLMQKSNGKYELAIWGEAFATETSSTATVKLDRTGPIKVYDIALGPTPVREEANASTVQLKLSDHAFIVEF